MKKEQSYELAKWRNEDLAPSEDYLKSWCSDSEPIIIGGCPRSGSTILRFLLGAAFGVSHGPECHLFLPKPIDLSSLSKRFGIPKERLKSLFVSTTSRAQFIEKFQALLLDIRGTNRWLEKTSRNVHAFEWILPRFPKAYIIHVIRDPRDVVVSLRTHPKYIRAKSELIPTNWIQPWDDCIDRWKRCVTDGLKGRGNPRYIEVHYENLILNKENEVEKLCDFVGIPFAMEMLDEKSRTTINSEQRVFVINNLNALGPISSNRMNRWKDELPTEVKIDLEIRLSELMNQLGYS